MARKSTPKGPPARSLEARENQVIAEAYDLAEKQILEGTASSQVIYHFLRLGSSRNRLEKELMAKKRDLMEAKTKAIASEDELRQLYKDALNAMRIYSGASSKEDLDEDYDEDSEEY